MVFGAKQRPFLSKKKRPEIYQLHMGAWKPYNWLALPVGNEGMNQPLHWYIGDETSRKFPTKGQLDKWPKING